MAQSNNGSNATDEIKALLNKLNELELKDAEQHTSLVPSDDCPTINKMAQMIENISIESFITDHMVKCKYCLSTFTLLLSERIDSDDTDERMLQFAQSAKRLAETAYEITKISLPTLKEQVAHSHPKPHQVKKATRYNRRTKFLECPDCGENFKFAPVSRRQWMKITTIARQKQIRLSREKHRNLTFCPKCHCIIQIPFSRVRHMHSKDSPNKSF